MLNYFKEKFIPISSGLILVFGLGALFYWNPPAIEKSVLFYDNAIYQLKVRYFYKPIKKNTPIAIVDIDDKSITEIGRWPWSRSTMAKLANNLFERNAAVVAFDMIFSESEKNILKNVIEKAKKTNPEVIDELESVAHYFDNDEEFAKSLEKGEAVLGFILGDFYKSVGKLPKPLYELSKEDQFLLIPTYQKYLANIPLLEKAGKSGGFLNASVDSDGIIRKAAFILSYENGIYPSLGLQSVMKYLLEDKFQLEIGEYPSRKVLEGIDIGMFNIPLDPWGQALIPFRGPPFTFEYISAAEVINGKVLKEKIENKLIFVGSSAVGIGDLFPTAMAPFYAGVEVHASIAAGVIDDYFPYKPEWRRGLSLALLIVLGLACVFIFPAFGPLFSLLILVLSISGLLTFDFWMWKKDGVVLSMFAPIFTTVLLYTLNELYGYFFEARKKKKMQNIFGQYVPPERIEAMMQVGEKAALQGENKEIAILFSDIRSFTTISEKLSAQEIKEFLNQYLTAMTQEIFNNKGTIDKYVGDMIVAFWGAPLDDPDRDYHAILSALHMQKNLSHVNLDLKKSKGIELAIGIGINTGVVNVGDMGSKFRRAYTVLGDAVNLGSRLESLTKQYHVPIIVGQNTFEKTKERFLFKLVDKVIVKGKNEAITIYEPVCPIEEKNDALEKEVNMQKEALEAYWKRDWGKSRQLLEELTKGYPMHTNFYGVYLKRIEELEKTPPDEKWDGVYVFHEK